MIYVVFAILAIYLIYQAKYIRSHITYNVDLSKILVISRENLIKQFVGGSTVIQISNNLYKLTKIHFRGYTKVMSRMICEKTISDYLEESQKVVSK